ncbi:hypothetical protein HKD42_09565 [Altererythrobacter sp. RZ02]|uniref:DUF4345 domain-containing protein n=1 Tax=Pontixanthobacter rizhaonensis TaxID=2730337 RepID=A0A848QS14_9SPHN|nr:hypothetical protein [Pontixanthobacter rizhaonensis]NMW32306.1 hypothetical protein [Pontixanthobacter rizhaonensis]
MIIALRAILVLGGLLLGFLGVGFLTDPVASGVDFGISAAGAHGLTSIRSDFTAFFMVGGACLIWGAIARRRDPLIIGGALMLVTLAARLVSLSINGSFLGYIPPMVVELVLGVAALIGARILPQRG